MRGDGDEGSERNRITPEYSEGIGFEVGKTFRVVQIVCQNIFSIYYCVSSSLCAGESARVSGFSDRVRNRDGRNVWSKVPGVAQRPMAVGSCFRRLSHPRDGGTERV